VSKEFEVELKVIWENWYKGEIEKLSSVLRVARIDGIKEGMNRAAAICEEQFHLNNGLNNPSSYVTGKGIGAKECLDLIRSIAKEIK